MSVSIERSFIQAACDLDGNLPVQVWRFVDRYLDDKTRPGISLERVHDFWSARVTQDLRCIIFRDGPDDFLLYVDHHDAAYRWAKRRKGMRNPRTNAVQVFLAVEEVAPRPQPRPAKPKAHPIFAAYDDDYLLSLGLPDEWLGFVHTVADEDDLLVALAALPDDVADRLFQVAAGKVVPPPAPTEFRLAVERVVESTDGTVSPDLDDFDRLLAAPLATWIAFLHPSQRRIATAAYSGPAKVTGTAGTGKTVVAMHRARHLARQNKRVLVTSYVTTLCENIEAGLRLLCTDEELGRIEVANVHQVARRLVDGRLAGPILSGDEVRERIERAARGRDLPLGNSALLAEWDVVVVGQGIDSWEGYRGASRAGRGTPLSVVQRQAVWEVLGRVRESMERDGAVDWQGLCLMARQMLERGEVEVPWDCLLVDEVQDLDAQGLRLVAALGGSGPDGLLVVGDGGQRIFAHRTSLRSAGVEVRGRSTRLRLNYRTTEQIRRFADRLLAGADDLDGDAEARDGTRSVRTGEAPELCEFATRTDQYDYVAEHVRDCVKAGIAPDEIAVVARTQRLLEDAGAHLDRLEVPTHLLQPRRRGARPPGCVQLVTMHRAKGLEFKVVVVVDASDDALPNAYAIRKAGDDQDRAEALERERQMLYVAITRARDTCLITYAGEPSPFLAPVLERAAA